MSLREDAAEIQDELVALRRELHQIPEIGLDLPKTQARVLEALHPLPLEVTTGAGLSSITAVLRGCRPGPVPRLRRPRRLDLPGAQAAMREGRPGNRCAPAIRIHHALTR